MKLWKIGILSIVILIPIFFVVFVLLTAEGGRFIVKEVLGKYVRASDIKLSESAGNLFEGMTFQNLEIKNIKNLPKGTTLKIQKIFFNITSLNMNETHVEIEDMRLKLPDSDPVIISGTFKEQQLDLNIFSNGFTVTEVLSYLPDFKLLVPIKGDVKDIDLFITGHYLEPIVKGKLTIEKFVCVLPVVSA